MNIIKIRHPYQSEQIPEDDVVLVLGYMQNMLFPVLIIRMDQKTLQMSLIFLNMPKEDSKSSQFLKKKNKVKKSALPVFEDY